MIVIAWIVWIKVPPIIQTNGRFDIKVAMKNKTRDANDEYIDMKQAQNDLRRQSDRMTRSISFSLMVKFGVKRRALVPP